MSGESYDEGKLTPFQERRFHFRGFAQRVTEEIFELDDLWIDTGSTYNYHLVASIIAERAYDLVYSSLDIESIKLLDMTPEEVIRKHIPDLDEFPSSS